MNADDFLRQSTTDIIQILTSPPSTTTISLQAGDDTRNGILQLAKLLNRTEKIPNLIFLPQKSITTKIVDNTPPQRVLKEYKKNSPPQRMERTLIKKLNCLPEKDTTNDS